MDRSEISVAILTNNQHHATRDKQCLVKLNVKSIKVFDDPEDVLESVRQQEVQLVLIDAAVRNMTGSACLRALRKAANTALLPAIMVTPESQLQAVVDAIAAGCNGYVIRPYSLQTFERHLRMAFESMSGDSIETAQLDAATELVAQGRFDEAISEFNELVEEENEAVAFFNKGMDYLRRRKFGKAILAFNKAVALNSMYAEAYKGMAYAYKGKGDDAGFRACLDKSASILAMQDRLDELKELFAEILQANPDAINPYNTMGIDLRKKGDYVGAMHAYTQALTLTPNDENLHYNIAKACIFSKDYDAAMEHLEKAAGLRQDFEEAKRLLAKLRAKQYDSLGVSNGAARSPSGRDGLAMDS
ncbi:response regulator receiver protein [Solidesulfovibrio fructosivorans JJ]]|uniref:Response regulator receiver protein n=1 Tax=Solidesulfovibrio fructosivorans JJ] TaxID=596151 RepID=E1JU31_SOLFR|nr:tetratricopeptide repeat protein [Solidesulfovibrio fructosivorans]EFL51961.1 response regulator receiver protein [Solidesulfovibrio fructosivorans JJ]]